MLNQTVQHYNLEVDFFRNFLDPYMKYTSGLFESELDELETATQRMLDVIIERGRVSNGSRVLEIGPGWGSLLRRLHERGIMPDYIGVSPSQSQNNYISNFAAPRESLVTSTFEEFNYEGPQFNSIVLIGSFCHLRDKQAQLTRMASLLKEEGCIVIEDTFFIDKDLHASHADNEATRYVQEKIFGFAEILSLSEQTEQIAKAGLKISYMLEHSDSYRCTIKSWIRNLKKLKAQDYPNAREFIKYMTIAQRGWNRTTQNQLLVLRKMR